MAPEKTPFHLGGATQRVLHLYPGTRVPLEYPSTGFGYPTRYPGYLAIPAGNEPGTRGKAVLRHAALRLTTRCELDNPVKCLMGQARIPTMLVHTRYLTSKAKETHL
eukprot:164303-Rhodomonas_salina.1